MNYWTCCVLAAGEATGRSGGTNWTVLGAVIASAVIVIGVSLSIASIIIFNIATVISLSDGSCVGAIVCIGGRWINFTRLSCRRGGWLAISRVDLYLGRLGFILTTLLSCFLLLFCFFPP